jgi:type II secretory pathway component GspD/PulD (secretin)
MKTNKKPLKAKSSTPFGEDHNRTDTGGRFYQITLIGQNKEDKQMLKPKYESLEELLKEVQATRGLDTNIEFITHVQDLIGHSTEDQLYELSKQYKETFYRVYDEAEGIESTLRFFASYSKF